MPYEFRSDLGVVRLVQVGRTWRIEHAGAMAGRWRSAEAAVAALVARRSMLDRFDGAAALDIPPDLLDWTPLATEL